jgi:hypothetical protein
MDRYSSEGSKNSGKLSLPSPLVWPIFVINKKQKGHPLNKSKNILSWLTVSCALLLGVAPLQAQQLYPGDVTNNGRVDNVDVLFWSYARGATGEPRNNSGTAWEAVDLPSSLWNEYYPGGILNYAYADCNGDGVVDDADLQVIANNYHKTQPTGVQEDILLPGAIQSDQQLELFAASSTVTAGETKEIGFYLGGISGTVPTFYGTAFTLVYDPSFVAGNGNQSDIDFTYDIGSAENDWYAGAGKDQADYFIWTDDDAGIAEVVLYKNDPSSSEADFGQIGQFSIVVEEVIFGLEANQTIDVVIPYTVDQDFQTSGFVSGDGIELIVTNAITSSSDKILEAASVKFYPNPALDGDRLQVELIGQEAEKIERLTVMSSDGRVLRSQRVDATKAFLEFGDIPRGVYLIKVTTDAGELVQQVVKQ